MQRRLFRRGLVQARRETVSPAAAGLAAPQEPRDIARGGVGFVGPFVAFRRLVDVMTGEISADRGNVAEGDISTLRELLCAMNADGGSTPGETSRATQGPFSRRLQHRLAG